MLDYGSEDIDGMDDDAGEEHEPPPTGRWTATSSYDIYMVDTPKESDGNKLTEDNPLEKQSKHRRHRRRSKPRHSKSNDTGTRDNNAADSAEDEDTFRGVTPGVEASCTGSIALEVVFGSLDNYRAEELIFDIVPFRSDYQALLRRTAFARF